MLDFTEEQKLAQGAVRAWCAQRLEPKVAELEANTITPYALMRELSATLGIADMARAAFEKRRGGPDPGAEGRAGMVALTYADAARFEPRAFHEFASARLASYAVPLFVRISPDADLTSTFKLRKIDLQRSGYDPTRTRDALYVRDAQAGRYVPLTAASLAALGIAPFAGD